MGVKEGKEEEKEEAKTTPQSTSSCASRAPLVRQMRAKSRSLVTIGGATRATTGRVDERWCALVKRKKCALYSFFFSLMRYFP